MGEVGLGAGDEAVIITKYTNIEEAKEATNAVNLHCFNRVINSQSFKYLSGREVYKTRTKANNKSRVNTDVVTDAGDHDQPSQ